MYKALDHQTVDVIPYNGGFGSMETTRRFLGERFHTAGGLDRTLFAARLFQSDIVNVPTAGYPGGPGIFEEVRYEGADHIIAETPFHGQLYWRKIPYFALPLNAPVRDEEDLDRLERPDVDRFKPKAQRLAKRVAQLHDLDYFVMTEIKGAFESPWMYLRGGPANFFADVVRRPRFAQRLIAFAFRTITELTELVLDEAQPDAVWMTEDLGETHAPFISPRTYRDLVQPWHEEIVTRVHRKGAKLMLHSHGNITPLLPDIVATQPDSIDPLDIADNIDLAQVKAEYGDRTCLMGGITKDIGRMSETALERHVETVFTTCGPTGFIAMTAGGIPAEMTLHQLNCYIRAIEKARRNVR